jgi:hypothetical protein
MLRERFPEETCYESARKRDEDTRQAVVCLMEEESDSATMPTLDESIDDRAFYVVLH